MEAALQVVHTVPGRIRIRLPLLKRNPDFETVLQTQVHSLSAVRSVRVNPAAKSLIVQYDPHSTSEASFNTNLATAVQSACPATLRGIQTHPADIPLQGQLLPCETIQLTPYEARQFAAIETWKHQQISGLKAIMGHLLMASQGLLNFFFLNRVLEKVASVCESACANWQQDWEKLKPTAKVEQVSDLRRGSLEVCDRLAEQVTQTALSKATLQGGVSGLFDLFGEVTDEALTLALALRTIHGTGLCYGYAPQTRDEKAFAWAIFNAAIALTQEEFEKTQVTLRNLQRSLNKQALEDETLKDTLEEDVGEALIDSAIEQGVIQLSGETLGGIVPILSVVSDVLADRDLIEKVSEAARREFQQRWLLENRKIRFPDAA